MPWVLPWEITTWQAAGSRVRCRQCGTEWTVQAEVDGSVAASFCATCEADTSIAVIEPGPGSEVRQRPFPPLES